jgi:anti-sigma factor RsiW
VDDCRDVRANVGRFVDAALAPAERELVECHLEVCQSCREEVGGLHALSASLDALAAPPVPERFAAGVMSRIDGERAKNAQPRSMVCVWRDWSAAMRVAAFATAVIACIAGVSLSSTMPARGRSDGDMRWLGIASGAPVVYAYGGSSK